VLGQLRERNLPVPAAIFAERLARILKAMRDARGREPIQVDRSPRCGSPHAHCTRWDRFQLALF